MEKALSLRPGRVVSMGYEDHLDITGRTVEILDAGEAVVAVAGAYLVATGIGEATVRVDGEICRVSVEKAKIHLVTVMGQSNAGNHFHNATSDVTCPVGTAYWWDDARGEPAAYTKPSMGFHAPLLAELYAQSAAAGEPVKPVLIWQEGITGKTGQSITKWAATKEDTGGTEATVEMMKACAAYYGRHGDRYEIVGNGVYWLQGETDVGMEPGEYTARFLAMWSKLKGAGAEYLAFFRVRKGGGHNGDTHEDLGYSGVLTAQLEMINRHSDMFLATAITENWTGSADTGHCVDIRNYLTFLEAYGCDGSYDDAYGNGATVRNGILTTTMKTLYGANNLCHYGKFGYGLLGVDAAYHMYRALHTGSFCIVKTDTSGKAGAQSVHRPGDVVALDLAGATENLAFRAGCGSTAGTLTVTVKNGEEDITRDVISREQDTFGTVDVRRLRAYQAPRITVTYHTAGGASGSVTYMCHVSK